MLPVASRARVHNAIYLLLLLYRPGTTLAEREEIWAGLRLFALLVFSANRGAVSGDACPCVPGGPNRDSDATPTSISFFVYCHGNSSNCDRFLRPDG